MTRACRVDANQGEIAGAFIRLGCTVAYTHRLGDGYPDLCVAVPELYTARWSGHYCGQVLLVEVKVPGGRLTPRERTWHQLWQGYPVEIVRTEDDVRKLLGIRG